MARRIPSGLFIETMKEKQILQETLPVTVVQDAERPLTVQEEEFCELYVRGGAGYAGKQTKCFREIFGEGVANANVASYRLIRDPRIHARIKELTSSTLYEAETIAVKLQVAETLKSVMEETSTREYTDRFGIPVSPAPLRAVAVNAAKALMDLYPVKHASESRLKIENGQGGVIFNVIVPQPVIQDQDDSA